MLPNQILILIALIAIPQCVLAEVSFKNDVMPVFMRAGCNGGSCHGAALGKDGFKLSLFGYDPEGDYYRLLYEQVGRRVNLASPSKSMLLEKATGTVPHTGGSPIKVDSPHYQTLLTWLEQGAPRDPQAAPSPVGIELVPERVLFDRAGKTYQAQVIATYSDGSRRDVSNLALYLTNNESIGTIDSGAVIRGHAPGGTHVFARFDRFTAGTELIVLPQQKTQWPDVKPKNYIDALVFEKLQELQLAVSADCDDATFLRRVTLDLTGKLPTPQEYKAAMAWTGSRDSIREKIVDTLMRRNEFGELWAAKWGEWLRIRTDTNPGSGTAMKAGWNYYHWLREHMIDGTPWDQLARELLTGNGSNFRNPASNYYTMLPQGMLDPMKLGEDTAQIFLGLRIQCAQCHNHPFDRWTIDDYYSFTSFFTGVKRKHGAEAREYFTFVDVEAPPAKHLVDERPMPAKFLGGDLAEVENKDPRKVLSEWMTSRENGLFRRNLANRVWDHFFGRGVVHPVDDVRISNPASNEPLLEELGRRLAVDYGYDARRLIRDICLSQTYQLSASTGPENARDLSRFSHAYLRRLRADVMFDCINQVLEVKPVFRRSTAERAVVMFEGGSHDNNNAYFFSTFGQAKRESVCTCETKTDASLSQALHLINGRTINNAFNRNPKFIPRLLASHTSNEQRVRALYVRILSREPSAEEMQKVLALKPTDSSDRRAEQQFFDAVAWGLLNSNEFIFNH